MIEMKSEVKKFQNEVSCFVSFSPRRANKAGPVQVAGTSFLFSLPILPYLRHPTNRRRYPENRVFLKHFYFQGAAAAAAGVRERRRMSFSSAQRLARAAVLLGAWDAALRVGLGSRTLGLGALRGAAAGGNVMACWCFGRVSVIVVRRWWWCRREGEDGAVVACACACASSGDGGRRAGDVSRLRGRAGIGLGRWVRAGLYDVGRRIWRARLSVCQLAFLRCIKSVHLRDGAEGYFSSIHLEPFLESACWKKQ